MKSYVFINTLLFSSLSCGSMYFLGMLVTNKQFDSVLSLVMLLNLGIGVLHLSDVSERLNKRKKVYI